ncbi:hypothetical protein PGTUg99_025722 [Puccinia graminis f. sp. tritici]|uniref:Uncharacterized protein n=1 Tax=Puccinia graminis f. sp. tritici TaxID=56615 RepID=A0A5B0PF49_PUCGR|nr:hypothetical protein PGTUg99_025722 [Puccinia graminis f. sp. tritici]
MRGGMNRRMGGRGDQEEGSQAVVQGAFEKHVLDRQDLVVDVEPIERLATDPLNITATSFFVFAIIAVAVRGRF